MPALKILSECETSIQSSRDWVLGVIRVGSLISWVTCRLQSFFFCQMTYLTSFSKMISFLLEMELMVEIRQLTDSAGKEGGLYMLPIVRGAARDFGPHDKIVDRGGGASRDF